MSEVRAGGRIDFSEATKKLVADRAGNECSFPTCDHRTTASEALPGLVSRSGKACHIYSGAQNGPRGQGGLTEEELKSPENCIWLCSNHATIVDNNRGIAYPPEELIAYKALQEARISRERQGLFIPVGWLFELVIRQSPIIQSGQRIRLATFRLHADVEGTVPGLPIRALSSREVERVFIELVTAAARAAGQHAPTVLILDCCPIVFEGFFDFYSHHFLDADNHFQTLMCIPTEDLDLESLQWNGWELIQMVGRQPDVSIRQEAAVS